MPLGSMVSWLAVCVLVGAAPSFAQETVGELEDVLFDRSDDNYESDFFGRRSGAVRKLAAIGTPEAWELVLQVLDDVSPRVGDEAQIRLAELADADVLRDLYGKAGLGAKSALTRVRVAEAFGRMALPIDGEALAAHAGREREPDVQRALLWSVERLAAPADEAGAEPLLVGDRSGEIGPDLERVWKRSDDAGVRAAALRAWCAVDPTGAEDARSESLADDDALVRVAALQVSGARDELAAALEDPAIPVRTEAVLGLAREATREDVVLLAAHLDREQETRLLWRTVDALRRLSGRRHGADARPWRDWSASLEEDWSPVDEAGAHEASGTSVASFAGLPILSEHVCFLVDFSGSLWEEREDGKTRKQVVDEQLRAALEALPEEVEFNVIAFTAEPHPWSDELQPARPRTVAGALEWFEEATFRGKGNFYDAAVLALRDPSVDTIVVLTDGAPSGGTRWNLGLMVPLLVEHTRFEHVTFDAVLVDCSDKLRRHWERLTEATGGRAVAMEL